MAVDDPIFFNNWWVYLREMYPSAGTPSDKQIWNAYKIRTALRSQGYGDKAIAGICGNAWAETGFSPGAIYKWDVLPNYGQTFAECTNAYMIQYYINPEPNKTYALALLQWNKYSATYQTNSVLGWTNANGYVWYDGDGQMARLDFEYNNDSTYHFWTMNYGSLTWSDFKNLETTYPSYDAGEAGVIWASCWELSSTDPTWRQKIRDNSNFWYQYFIDNPNPPPIPTTGIPEWMYGIINQKRRLYKNVKKL